MRQSPDGPARGILRDDAPITHRRVAPCPALEAFIAHFWWVRWSLDTPFTAETLPHPCVHLVFEPKPTVRAEIVGLMSERFERHLEGRGWVLGVKFRPAMFQPFAGGDVARFSDRRWPGDAVFGASIRAAYAKLERMDDARPESVDEAIAALEAWLLESKPETEEEAISVRDLVERIEHDRELMRVEEAAATVAMSPRTLSRRFRRYVGASPKQVIRRYRLIEAAEQLKQSGTGDLAALAARLEYFDQAHFARDFKALVGQSPGAFAAQSVSE